jgi:hypothetical protein
MNDSPPHGAEPGDALFPQRLDDVPSDECITRKYGWQWGNWGSLFVLLSVSLPAMQADPVEGGAAFAVVAFGVVGLCMVAYEVWRRRRRTTLYIRENRVGIYRRGRLDTVAVPGEMPLYVFAGANTVQIVFIFSIVGAMLACLSIMADKVILRFVAGYAAAVCISAAISSLRTRWLSTCFIIPRAHGADEWVIVSEEAGARLLSLGSIADEHTDEEAPDADAGPPEVESS